MRKLNGILQKSLITTVIFVFIVFYITFISINFIVDSRISSYSFFFLFLGFIIFIISIYLSFNFIPENVNLKFRFFSENVIKAISIVLMIICFYSIPSITFSSSIMDWKEIKFLNLVRGFVFLMTSSYLPGSCIFNIFFKNSELNKRFKVDSFLLKITIYPLLSFSLLGLLVLIFDQAKFNKEIIGIVLFLIIILLFFLELIIQKLRKQKIKNLFIKVRISKITILIMLISIGILLLSIGIAIEENYLIPGDSWVEIAHSNYIGSPEGALSTSWVAKGNYPLFWSYVTFALSILSGLPYININVLMILFLYLFVTTIYLFLKVILKGFKESYVIISMIFTITFSGIINIFKVNPLYEKGNISPFIFDGLLNFRYKSFAIFLLFFGLALILLYFPKDDILKDLNNYKREKYKYMNLSALFLIFSYMTYMFPLIFGLIIISIYCLFKKSRQKALDIKYLSHFVIFVIIYFIIFDLLMNFYLSNLAIQRLDFFFNIPLLSNLIEIIPEYLIVYFILFLYYILLLIIQVLYTIFFEKNLIKIRLKYRINSKIIIILFVIFFFVFAFFSIVFLQLIFNESLYVKINRNFLFYFLNIYFFAKIGIVGSFGIALCYFCYKKDSNLFLILIIWIIIILFISSLKFVEIFIYFFPDIPDINEVILVLTNQEYNNLEYWYTRTWYYTIPAFSILFTISLIELNKRIKKIRIFHNQKYLKKALKNFTISVFIFISFSNLIIAGLFWQRLNYRVKDDEAQIIGWTAEHIPEDSIILIDAEFEQHLSNILDWKIYNLLDSANIAFNEYYNDTKEWWFISYGYDTHCNLDFLDNYNEQQNILEFADNNTDGNVNLGINFNSPQKYGTIEYLIYSTSTSDRFWVELSKRSIDGPHLWNGSFSYYNGTEYVQLQSYEMNQWYHIKIEFECTNGGYKGLNQYKWNLYINNTEYRNLRMLYNSSHLESITFATAVRDSEWQVYIDILNFSWYSGFNIEDFLFNSIFIEKYLLDNDIQYFIHKNDIEVKYVNSQDLIRNYFKVKKYEYKSLSIYSTH